MYKKIVLLIVLCFLVVISCSSPSSPNSGSDGDIVNGGGSGETGGGSGSGGDSGNTGDGGNTGGIDVPWTDIEEPLMPPVPILDAEAMQYGIDISQEDSVIKEQIKTKLKKYESGKYKVIFIGTPKKEYAQRNSLTYMVLEVIKNMDNLYYTEITIDVSKVYFNERKIKSGMFQGGVSLGYLDLKFILPENSIRVIEGRAFRFLNNYLKVIEIPDSVIGIDAAAFQPAETLATITFKETSKLEYIGDYAFSYAIAKEILIPASVKLIGTKAFGDSITTVTYLGTSPNAISHSENVFPSTAKTLILPNVADPKFDEWKNFLGGNFTEVKQHK
ncbi:leucine-rich repeat protein [Brachyspira pilosicoli]|uniref:leucine-rich repeat protein n=1 Tax=Brachyspira pilosicoli TaxID=52584 RepID=UPI0030048546